MALPKKKKRLLDTRQNDPESSASVFEEDLESITSVPMESTGMNDQMEKAFEIVDTIEQIHPLPEVAPSGQSSIPQFNQLDPENVRIKLSLGTHDEPKNKAAIPVISIQLKIPSFLWRIPVISGVARNIIRKFTQE